MYRTGYPPAIMSVTEVYWMRLQIRVLVAECQLLSHGILYPLGITARTSGSARLNLVLAVQ